MEYALHQTEAEAQVRPVLVNPQPTNHPHQVSLALAVVTCIV